MIIQWNMRIRNSGITIGVKEQPCYLQIDLPYFDSDILKSEAKKESKFQNIIQSRISCTHQFKTHKISIRMLKHSLLNIKNRTCVPYSLKKDKEDRERERDVPSKPWALCSHRWDLTRKQKHEPPNRYNKRLDELKILQLRTSQRYIQIEKSERD